MCKQLLIPLQDVDQILFTFCHHIKHNKHYAHSILYTLPIMHYNHHLFAYVHNILQDHLIYLGTTTHA